MRKKKSEKKMYIWHDGTCIFWNKKTRIRRHKANMGPLYDVWTTHITYIQIRCVPSIVAGSGFSFPVCRPLYPVMAQYKVETTGQVSGLCLLKLQRLYSDNVFYGFEYSMKSSREVWMSLKLCPNDFPIGEWHFMNLWGDLYILFSNSTKNLLQVAYNGL